MSHNPPPHENEAQEVENFLDTYRTIAEWIRFADTKAAVVLTVNAALLGLLIPTLKEYLARPGLDLTAFGWPPAVLGLFLAWLAFVITSSICAALCILPFSRKGRHPSLGNSEHFHPAAIASTYRLDEVERFANDCERLGLSGFKREIMAAILADSHISNRKYRWVTRSIQQLAVSAVFGLLYLICIQIPS